MILDTPERIRTFTEQGWWGDETIVDLFLANAEATPDRPAVADPPNRAEFTAGRPRRLSYAELRDEVDRLASALLAGGVGRDQVVMIQLPNVVELVIAYLAIGRIGAIASPLPVQYRSHELRQTMEVVRPVAFLTTTDVNGFDHAAMVESLRDETPWLRMLAATGAGARDGWASLERLLAEPADRRALESHLEAGSPGANDVLTICWTSGTEADPKGVPRGHNHWIAIAWATTDGAELEPGCVMLNPFPMVNMSGIGGMLVPWLQTGGTLVMHQPLNLPVFLRQITEEGVNYTVAPPVLLTMLLGNPDLLANVDLSSIRTIGSGSAPLAPSMVVGWKERHGIEVVNFFGANEGTALVGGPREIPDPEERARSFPRFGAQGLEWSNRVARGMRTKLVDPITREEVVHPGEAGEMMVAGPTIFPGYFARPDLTGAAFDDEGFFATGDLFEIVEADGDPSRYRYVGRWKDVIVRGGMKISAEEVEGLLAAHPKVAEVAVVGVARGGLGEETVTAIVVPHGGQEISLGELVEPLRAKDVATYKLPKKLVVVEALPRNPVGKVLKRVLREELASAERGR